MPAEPCEQMRLWADERADPRAHGRPTESAFWHGSIASRTKDRGAQRELGQYMTPPSIARLIARRMVEGKRWSGRTVRLLDPAAGSGVLSAALIEAIAVMPQPPRAVELVMCEIDRSMQPLLERCARDVRAMGHRAGIAVKVKLQWGDFLLGALARSGEPTVDAVIANPPYFKLGRRDPRALAHEAAVHGQPNIYALFMSACAALLRPGGAFGFITPRSWTNGAYFRATRRVLRSRLAIDALHLFDSREAHFEADAILQEALITWGTAAAAQADVTVSTSHGAVDLDLAETAVWPAARVLGTTIDDPIVLPADATRAPGLPPFTLADLGLRVVTGPVVGFRARAHLRGAATDTTVPMLWMPHVQRSRIAWPLGRRSEHIDANAASAWMLLSNEPMVLLRRFSPKEDERRVTAAPYEAELPGAVIGLENHLNVIRGERTPMSVAAARGLSAWLESRAVDAHLRQRLGSTQVNAVELRALPVPDLAALERLGRRLPAQPGLDLIDIEVERVILEATPRHGVDTRVA